jgi:hypothetical protein
MQAQGQRGITGLMLFTDADIVSAADLQRLDPECGEVLANVDQSDAVVPLEGSGSICELATSEASSIIQAVNQSFSSGYSTPGISSVHLSWVNNTGMYQGSSQPRCKMSQIVVHNVDYGTSWSTLKHWVAHLALMILYRTVAARKTEDRYVTKMIMNQTAAAEKWNQLMTVGLPVVQVPFPAPGAKMWPDAGTFSAANVTAVVAPTTAGGAKRVAICWVDGTRYNATLADRGDAESGPSAIVPITVPSNSVVSVSIASLNPPDGTNPPTGFSQGFTGSIKATAWNLFVGAAAGPMYLQNATPIPVATLTYALPGDPVVGKPMRNGQNPLRNLLFMPNQIQRM